MYTKKLLFLFLFTIGFARVEGQPPSISLTYEQKKQIEGIKQNNNGLVNLIGNFLTECKAYLEDTSQKPPTELEITIPADAEQENKTIKICNVEIKPGETTKDLLFKLETVNCLGACALGPLVVIDKEYHGNMTAQKIVRVLDKYK